MDKLLIQGGLPLSGEIAISGAKNAALPVLCASLLAPETLHLSNVPRLKDVSTMLRLIEQMGVAITRDAEVNFAELLWDADVDAAEKETARAQLAALGIIAR